MQPTSLRMPSFISIVWSLYRDATVYVSPTVSIQLRQLMESLLHILRAVLLKFEFNNHVIEPVHVILLFTNQFIIKILRQLLYNSLLTLFIV